MKPDFKQIDIKQVSASKVVLYMDVDLTSILSRSYGFEDVLDDSDICALHNAAKEGIITKCPLLLQLCK